MQNLDCVFVTNSCISMPEILLTIYSQLESQMSQSVKWLAIEMTTVVWLLTGTFVFTSMLWLVGVTNYTF